MERGLSLTRKEKEAVVCTLDGKQVCVIVDSISGGKVKLKFVADKSVQIYRSEILTRGVFDVLR